MPIAEWRATTGLDYFGPDLSFLAGHRKLVEAVEAMDPQPEPRASTCQIVAQDVGDPLVCGLPRTGTTIVYDLLCLAMKVAFGFSGGLLIELLQQTNDDDSVFREMLTEKADG